MMAIQYYYYHRHHHHASTVRLVRWLCAYGFSTIPAAAAAAAAAVSPKTAAYQHHHHWCRHRQGQQQHPRQQRRRSSQHGQQQQSRHHHFRICSSRRKEFISRLLWLSSSSSSSSSPSPKSSSADGEEEEETTDHDTTTTTITTSTSADGDDNAWSEPCLLPIYYNDVYHVPLPPNHRFPMKKYRRVRTKVQDAIQALSLEHQQQRQQQQQPGQSIIQCEFRVSPLVSWEDLVTTHCPDYVERYTTGRLLSEIEIRNLGFPWSREGVNRALSSTGGTVAAARSVCQAKRRRRRRQQQQQQEFDGATAAPAAAAARCRRRCYWSAHLAGGTHHAFRDRGEGFCAFSDIAVAANVILRDYPDIVRKILIIDLDVHQGNGNAVLFQDVEEVTTFSMHCSANYFSEKQHSDLDIELAQGCKDGTYLATLHHWLNRVKRGDAGRVDFIFFQAGVDILEDDRLGKLSITQDGIARRNEMVFDLAKHLDCPLCITMGGGYPKQDWEPILEAHANVYIQAYQYLIKHG